MLCIAFSVICIRATVYVPKRNWHEYGGHTAVIGYIANRYAQRYASVWPDFLQRAGAATLPQADGSARFVLSPEPVPRTPPASSDTPGVAASYRYSRLCFRADVIEPLDDNDVFEVVTPEGRFRMTKAEFRRSFPKVIASNSYREGRIYHYPRAPVLALQFRVPD